MSDATNLDLPPDFPGKLLYDMKGGAQGISVEGLIWLAHKRRLFTKPEHGIRPTIIQIPVESNERRAVVQVAVMTDVGTFESVGDADPQNCPKLVSAHLLRMAETRATGRALLKALNIGHLDVAGDVSQSSVRESPGRGGSAGKQWVTREQQDRIKALARDAKQPVPPFRGMSSADADDEIARLQQLAQPAPVQPPVHDPAPASLLPDESTAGSPRSGDAPAAAGILLAISSMAERLGEPVSVEALRARGLKTAEAAQFYNDLLDRTKKRVR